MQAPSQAQIWGPESGLRIWSLEWCVDGSAGRLRLHVQRWGSLRPTSYSRVVTRLRPLRIQLGDLGKRRTEVSLHCLKALAEVETAVALNLTVRGLHKWV